MNNVKTQDKFEQLAVSSQRVFPADSYPRKYVHSVFDDLQDAAQAIQALRAAGYDAGEIHFMESRDYVQAVERGNQQQSGLFNQLMRFVSSFDYDFADMYLREAYRGHHILAVRLSRYEQIEQVRDLLAPRHAHLIKYIDTWTVADLSPSPATELRRVS